MARHPEPTAVPAKIATEARKRLNASASSSEEDGDFSPTMWLLVLRVRVFSLKEEEEMAAISTSPSFDDRCFFSRRSRFCPRLGEEEEEVLSFSYRVSLLLCGIRVRRESSEKYPI
jgi:hypothetical protein